MAQASYPHPQPPNKKWTTVNSRSKSFHPSEMGGKQKEGGHNAFPVKDKARSTFQGNLAGPSFSLNTDWPACH